MFPWQWLLELIASPTHRHRQQPSERCRWPSLITDRLLVLALRVTPLAQCIDFSLLLLRRSSKNIIDVEIAEEALFVVAVC